MTARLQPLGTHIHRILDDLIMTRRDAVTELLIAVDEPKYRDRTIAKRDRNDQRFPPVHEIRLINEQIQMLVDALGKPTDH